MISTVRWPASPSGRRDVACRSTKQSPRSARPCSQSARLARVLADPTALTVVSITATVSPVGAEHLQAALSAVLGGCRSPTRARSMTTWPET